MFSAVELLDLARQRQGGVSDYRIAQILDIRPNTLSGYRSGRALPENPIVMGLAELAGVDQAEAVLAVNLERAKTPEERQVWEMLLARVSAPKKAKKGH